MPDLGEPDDELSVAMLGTEAAVLGSPPGSEGGMGGSVLLGLEKWNPVLLWDLEGLLALKVHILGNRYKPCSNPTTIDLGLPVLRHTAYSRASASHAAASTVSAAARPSQVPTPTPTPLCSCSAGLEHPFSHKTRSPCSASAPL